MADKQRAKEVVIEIVRIAGTVRTKTHLYKMFYFAHLWYARNAPDYLTDWPIVRMPNGPGIGDADMLLDELIADGVIGVRTTSIGPYSATEYRIASDAFPETLTGEAIDAIREAVSFAKQKTAAELSEITHEFSRSWRESANGTELNIYLDLLSDKEYTDEQHRMREIASELDKVW